jgi:hypothetical protein
MSRTLKPLPKNAAEISQEQVVPYIKDQGKPVSDTVFSKNRGKDFSFKGDTVKDVSVGLEDLDYAVMYYFENIIKPNIVQNGQRLAVPVIYGSPERWKSVQSDGFYRDAGGRLMVPLIMFKRENIEKNRTLGNKLDGNRAHLYQVIGTKYNIRNAYDKFSVINNRIPSEQYYMSAVPDYVTLTYSCIVFTNFVEQNNKLIEAIEFASDAYWGDPNRWKFKTRIDNFTTTTLLEEGTDRAAKTSFNIILNGYIIPDTVNKDLAVARSKFYTTSQVVFNLEVIDTGGTTTNIDELRFANKPAAKNATGATSFIGGGINITQNITTGGASSGDLVYINTNITKIANIVTPVSSKATFTGASVLQPPAGSTLPPTTVNNFTFYINGQYVPSSLVTLVELGGNVEVTFNTASLGYVLETDDEVVAIGKFTS